MAPDVDDVSEIRCTQCGAASPPGKKYCADCGAPMGGDAERILAALGPELDRRIAASINARMQDKDAVVTEISAQVVDHVFNWAKLVGIPLGIALGLLGLALGLLGISSIADFRSKVAAGIDQVNAAVAKAQKQARDAGQQADQLTGQIKDLGSQYRKLKDELADVGSLAQDVRSLSADVAKIKEKIGFVSSSSLTPQLQRQLSDALTRFQVYLAALGFQPPSDQGAQVEIRDKAAMNEAIAYYDPSSRRMVINSDYANSPDFLLREYAHRALIYTGSPFTGPDAEKDWRYISLESGLASYFPCSFKAAPIFGGGGFVLDLSKHHTFAEIRPSYAYAVSDGMAVWGSSFWALRQIVGQSIADKLLLDSWFRLQGRNASAQYWQQYVHQLTRGYQAMGGTNVHQIIELFESRGLKL